MIGPQGPEIAEMFAEQAAVLVANAEAYHNAAELSEQLKEALKSRELIGQAKGILMEREGCTADEAFDMLRRTSQNQNLKLRDVAQRLVDSCSPGSGAPDERTR